MSWGWCDGCDVGRTQTHSNSEYQTFPTTFTRRASTDNMAYDFHVMLFAHPVPPSNRSNALERTFRGAIDDAQYLLMDAYTIYGSMHPIPYLVWGRIDVFGMGSSLPSGPRFRASSIPKAGSQAVSQADGTHSSFSLSAGATCKRNCVRL